MSSHNIIGFFLLIDELSEEDRLTVARARKIERFLSQPFFVAEVFTGSPGKYVGLAETIRGFKLILSGELDGLPEQAFYLVGNIDEATAKRRFSEKYLVPISANSPSSFFGLVALGQEILNGDVGGGFRGIQITSGFFQIWRAPGITTRVKVKVRRKLSAADQKRLRKVSAFHCIEDELNAWFRLAHTSVSNRHLDVIQLFPF
ncbi:hypothetical protein HN51_045133 [Arachis hypogaea]